MANYGFVYVISHDFMPNVYKVGYTDRAPMQRLQELSSSTSVPPGFNLVFYGEFANPSSVESSIHEQLKDYRIHSSREFFEFDKVFVTQNLYEWMKKNALNMMVCNEFYNLLALEDVGNENIDTETFGDEVVNATAQAIENAKEAF